MNKIDLEGMNAVVTGGAGGLGRAIARRFLASGAKVAVWDRQSATTAAEELGATLGVHVDVANESSVSDAFRATEQALGTVDILVAGAGMTGPTVAVIDHPVADWRLLLEVHLTGTLLCCQAVLPGMLERNYGRIVTVSSVAGKEGLVDAAGYSAAKAGIIGFTKTLGKELAKTEVRANCIAPGMINTPLMDQLPDGQIAAVLEGVPMGRFGTAAEFAALVAWMSSAECSFNAGAVFDLSGGRITY